MAAEEAVPPQTFKVIAFCGSLRAASCNAGIVRYAQSVAGKVSLEFTTVDVSAWPLFNVDDEREGKIPEDILAAAQLALDCDGVIVASPEYNFSIAPAASNAVGGSAARSSGLTKGSHCGARSRA